MKKFISLVATSLILLLASNTASARLIEGAINFGGDVKIVKSATEDKVSTLEFIGLANISSFKSGDFSTITDTTAQFSNFDAATPLNLFWTAGDFTFTITSVLVNMQNSTFGVSLSGMGIISNTVSGTTLEDTVGTWKFTSQDATQTTFSARSVPAPAGTALLGLCLLGFAFSRRNKKA